MTGAAIACESSASNSAMLPGFRPGSKSRRYSSSGSGNGAISRAPSLSATRATSRSAPSGERREDDDRRLRIAAEIVPSQAADDGGNLLLEPRHVLIAQIAMSGDPDDQGQAVR